MRLFKIVLTLAGLFSSSLALAGPQYIDKTGFAVSGYDVVAYFGLESKAVGEEQVRAVPGRADITAEHNGATFAFANEENRDLFVANPHKYAPQFDGHCAYGVSKAAKSLPIHICGVSLMISSI